LFPNKDETIPVILLKVFALLDNTINGVTNEQKKKMNKVNSVSFNKLKQKFKKYLQSEGEGDELYEKQLEKYKENPPSESESEEEDSDEEEDEDSDEEEEEEESEEEESEEEVKEKPKKKEEPKKKAEDSEPDSDEEEEEDEEGDEYYDEEDEEAEEEDSDEDKVDTTDVDASLLTGKYAFLFKPREEMTPQQRRWKWVKKECLPIEIRNILERKPKKDKGEKKERERKVNENAEEGAEFITEIRTRDDMTLDYSQSHVVLERLPLLKQERLKGRYDPEYHVKVLDLMA